ncbi:uncharacterized protein LOC116602235 isoform X2 [Nematostella vectensis]|uniref:uncharacterized protein LOC116602235 isoform X2 n=1 Tax=Nematostella vectensis TaxID=45351 RepID=UPI00207730F8|nr:uncharacterized protein LOC116602235 isoform X2 [Nematostella vectensis]
MCGCIKKQCIDIAKNECPGWCKAKLERIRICQKESKTCKSGKKGKCITEFKACLLEADNWLVKMRCRAKMCGCIKKGDNCGKTLRSCMQKAKGDADKNTTCLQAHNECKERQQGDEEWDSYTTDAAWGY